jgi:autotransporter passenger strand-loop-strand repeat protein
MARNAFRTSADTLAGDGVGEGVLDVSLDGVPRQPSPAGDPVASAAAVSFALSDMAGLAGASLVGTSAAIGSGGATAAQLRQALGETAVSGSGAGIKIGVLSDSFNNLGGAAADEASGALPSAANIQVVKDLASGGTDEGRAMMQVIHDIAPNASLAFYTAVAGEQDFANGILALAAAGCRVICDDVFYYDEPMFQNGVVARAIETVEKQGVTVVTAAGNNGSNAYQSAWIPISGSFDGVSLTNTLSFNGSVVQTVTVGANSNYQVPLLLQWSQPYGAATASLELLVFRNGSLYATATNAAVGEPTNPWTGVELAGGFTYQIAIENLSGANPGLIKEVAAGNGLPVTIAGANVGTIYGHALTPGTITAGAVNAANTAPFGGTPQPESFSSWGNGSELLFNDSGIAYATAIPLSPVDAAAVDNVSTTLPGLSDFYGTSAASASMAGVAAMILAADPNLTPYEVETLLDASTVPAGNSNVVGAGLVQVDQAVSLATAYAATGQHVSAVYAGQTSQGAVVGAGVTLLVRSYASATQTTVQAGGKQVVSGAASGTSVGSGGVEAVSGGGVASGSVVSNGGQEQVGSGGAANAAVVSSGGLLTLLPGGSATNAQVRSGGTLTVSSGAVLGATQVSNYGDVAVSSGGVAGVVTATSHGKLDVLGGGIASGATLSNGGQIEIWSAGSGQANVIGSGGLEVVDIGGAASGTIVSNGGIDFVYGTASNTTVLGGGAEYLGVGGRLSGGTVSGGGDVAVSSGALASGVTVVGHGVLEVLNGGAASAVLVQSGGQLLVSSGGGGVSAAIGSGGQENVVAGGSASGTTLSSGAIGYVYGTARTTTVLGGGSEFVGRGGVAIGTAVLSAGLIYVSSGGTASGAVVGNRSLEEVEAGALAVATTVSSGATDYVFGSSTSGTVSSGGLALVLGAATGMTIGAGADVLVSSGASATAASVAGVLEVLTGGLASATIVLGGGRLLVSSGGVDRAASVGSGGQEIVVAGGSASGMVVSSGGVAFVYGTASTTAVLGGGVEYVGAGARLGGGTVSNGGSLQVSAGGVASGVTATGSRAELDVLNGAIASGASATNGGQVDIWSGGVGRATSIGGGGQQVVTVGGSASGTIVANGGVDFVYGTASNTTVLAGGADYVGPGATLNGATVGGTLEVKSGGTAGGATVMSGGAETVDGSGTLAGATLAGGFIEIKSGGTAGTSEIDFAGGAGGTLQLDDSQHFSGLISGFGVAGGIDLRDIAFSSATTTLAYSGTISSGTLTVTDSVLHHSASIQLLGQYAAGNFTLQTDNNGGTLVTDPPLAGPTSVTSPHA